MKSYIAIALVLSIAVAQVMSQGTSSSGAAGSSSPAAAAGFMGRSMLPLMAAQGGNDMMQNFLLFRMLSQGGLSGRSGAGGMRGLEPLLMGNLLGLELFGM